MASKKPLKSRLRWQCRRGMLELDYILNQFLEQQFDTLEENDQRQFETLLTFQDKDILNWVLNKTSPIEPQLKDFIQKNFL